MRIETFLNRESKNPALTAQCELLSRCTEVLRNAQDCSGAIVCGSLSFGTADRLSDVDLVVYCYPGTSARLMEQLRKAASVKEVFYRLDGRHDEFSVFEKTINFDFSSYEIHVVEPMTRFRLTPPYIEIVDRDGYLSTRLAERPLPTRRDQKPYLNGDAGLVWDLFNCIKWLRRGEYGDARDYIVRAAEAIQALPPKAL